MMDNVNCQPLLTYDDVMAVACLGRAYDGLGQPRRTDMFDRLLKVPGASEELSDDPRLKELRKRAKSYDFGEFLRQIPKYSQTGAVMAGDPQVQPTFPAILGRRNDYTFYDDRGIVLITEEAKPRRLCRGQWAVPLLYDAHRFLVS